MIKDKQVSSRAQYDTASVVWFISFGDLLTLLVCFFLLLTPWGGRHEPLKISKNQEVTVGSHVAEADGTSFAYRPVGQKYMLLAEVPLLKSDLSSQPRVTREELTSVLRKYSTAGKDRSTSLFVRICDQSVRSELFKIGRAHV